MKATKKKRKQNKDCRIFSRMEAQDVEALRWIAVDEDINLSQLIRRVLKKYLKGLRK